MMDFEHITWTCHVCGDLRLDKNISVHSFFIVEGGKFEVQRNIRYCNDRLSCIEGAKEIALEALPLKS